MTSNAALHSTFSVANPLYNSIAKGYDVTRRADAAVAAGLFKLLQPQLQDRFLDIGCGSGNYTAALRALGLTMTGVDVSSEMIKMADQKDPLVNWHVGDACQLPFPDGTFGGACCVLATHLIGDIAAFCREAWRVLKRGRLVIFTTTPELLRLSWLKHYFPQLIQNESQRMASHQALDAALVAAGFRLTPGQPFFVQADVQDMFLQAGKYCPARYLDPQVRSGISAFHVAAEPTELEVGLKSLAADINTGAIHQIMAEHEHDAGEYVFIVGEKT